MLLENANKLVLLAGIAPKSDPPFPKIFVPLLVLLSLEKISLVLDLANYPNN
jgi:hypothetical protein